jgi:hypothetical protein
MIDLRRLVKGDTVSDNIVYATLFMSPDEIRSSSSLCPPTTIEINVDNSAGFNWTFPAVPFNPVVLTAVHGLSL